VAPAPRKGNLTALPGAGAELRKGQAMPRSKKHTSKSSPDSRPFSEQEQEALQRDFDDKRRFVEEFQTWAESSPASRLSEGEVDALGVLTKVTLVCPGLHVQVVGLLRLLRDGIQKQGHAWVPEFVLAAALADAQDEWKDVEDATRILKELEGHGLTESATYPTTNPFPPLPVRRLDGRTVKWGLHPSEQAKPRVHWALTTEGRKLTGNLGDILAASGVCFLDEGEPAKGAKAKDSGPTPKGAPETVPGRYSVAELVKKLKVPKSTLAHNLQSYRGRHVADPDAFTEVPNAGRNRPRFLYPEAAAREALKRGRK